MMLTFDQALKLMPACLVGAFNTEPATFNDLRFAALHEIDCYESREDGHLTTQQISAVRRFLTKIGEEIEL
jgi:hypothetical protein